MTGKLTGASAAAIVLYSGFGFTNLEVAAAYSACASDNIAINYPSVDLTVATPVA